MNIRSIHVLTAVVFLCAGTSASADVWDLVRDYSTTQNPSGAWMYGRKWSPNTPLADVFNMRWGDSGWYLGFPQYSPSIQGSVIVWPDNNANGLPVVRWTAPATGFYSAEISFTVADSRGGDNNVYVVANNQVLYSSRIQGYGGTTSFSTGAMHLPRGASIDLVVEWVGGVYYDYGWTSLTEVISGGACIADYNEDGAVNSQDFFHYLIDFFAAVPAADVNGDGVVNSQDFFDFVTRFFGGC